MLVCCCCCFCCCCCCYVVFRTSFSLVISQLVFGTGMEELEHVTRLGVTLYGCWNAESQKLTKWPLTLKAWLEIKQQRSVTSHKVTPELIRTTGGGEGGGIQVKLHFGQFSSSTNWHVTGTENLTFTCGLMTCDSSWIDLCGWLGGKYKESINQ